MSNKIVIHEIVTDKDRINSSVLAIIFQSPKEVFENHKLTLSKIAAITKSISKVAQTKDMKYRLDMKVLTREDDDFYIEECDRIMKGNKPLPVYETIDAFFEKYEYAAPQIMEKITTNNMTRKRSSSLK